MDSAITISSINDFLFCPKSLYLHNVYNVFDTSTYHDTPQVQGGIAHENIEDRKYTTSKHILQGISVYSNKLNVKGRIDVFDSIRGLLIERKYKVKKLYKGFYYQLYAQMYCLEEMGYTVKKLFIQSLSDNKRYSIPLPTNREREEFENTLTKIKLFTDSDLQSHFCKNCEINIYSFLNW